MVAPAVEVYSPGGFVHQPCMERSQAQRRAPAAPACTVHPAAAAPRHLLPEVDLNVREGTGDRR